MARHSLQGDIGQWHILRASWMCRRHVVHNQCSIHGMSISALKRHVYWSPPFLWCVWLSTKHKGNDFFGMCFDPDLFSSKQSISWKTTTSLVSFETYFETSMLFVSDVTAILAFLSGWSHSRWTAYVTDHYHPGVSVLPCAWPEKLCPCLISAETGALTMPKTFSEGEWLHSLIVVMFSVMSFVLRWLWSHPFISPSLVLYGFIQEIWNRVKSSIEHSVSKTCLNCEELGRVRGQPRWSCK